MRRSCSLMSFAASFSWACTLRISRIASADTEDMLVDWARHGLASQLHRVVSGYRRTRRR